MYPLKVPQGLGDYIKNREPQMMGEKLQAKCTHLGECEFQILEEVSKVLSNKRRVY